MPVPSLCIGRFHTYHQKCPNVVAWLKKEYIISSNLEVKWTLIMAIIFLKRSLIAPLGEFIARVFKHEPCVAFITSCSCGQYCLLTDCYQWASYQIRKIAGCACAGNAGNVFPRRRFQIKPLVSDPGMHHGTCVTHVPWCMSGSLTCGDGENVPGIPGACAPAILRIWQEAHYVDCLVLSDVETTCTMAIPLGITQRCIRVSPRFLVRGARAKCMPQPKFYSLVVII